MRASNASRSRPRSRLASPLGVVGGEEGEDPVAGGAGGMPLLSLDRDRTVDLSISILAFASFFVWAVVCTGLPDEILFHVKGYYFYVEDWQGIDKGNSIPKGVMKNENGGY
mmetsp:Transcript_38490/g.83612  ORF Transcript_38490/g.83612 Transcript_38490/m.83612 type:complete len:111 (-) Transcript_38490:64-396(-)